MNLWLFNRGGRALCRSTTDKNGIYCKARIKLSFDFSILNISLHQYYSTGYFSVISNVGLKIQNSLCLRDETTQN